jgi:hypothetical protein
MIRKSLPLLLLLLAACARSEEANLVPSDGNEAREVETVRPERDDEELALGEWRNSLQEEEAALEFGPRGAAPLLSLRCDARRGVLLQRHGTSPVGDLPVMLVTVGSETRRLAVTRGDGPIPMLRAALPASDQLLAILAGATSPIAIRIGDSPLILPPSPMIGAYITRCATGAPARGARASEGGNAAAPANVTAPANVATPAGE